MVQGFRSSWFGWRALALALLLIGLASSSPAVAEEDDEAPAAPADPAPAPAADDQPAPPAAAGDADHDGTPDADEVPAPAAAGAGADDAADGIIGDDTDADHDGVADSADNDDDNDGVPDAAEDDADDVRVETLDDGTIYIQADADGDGVVSAEELAEEGEFDAAYADIPDEINDDALDLRPDLSELMPSLSIETFRKLVRLAKRKVLARMEIKIQRKADAKMKTISNAIFLGSLAGVLLLLLPFGLMKKYPGQTGNLFKYAALAAATFIVTVNLFAVIMVGMRTTQSALSKQTNPQLKIAAGFFDALDQHAPRYVIMGKELFAPTLEQLDGRSDEQPAGVLIGNGQKIVAQASVFKGIATLFKRVNFVFGVLPIVLLGVTLLLFVLAIKPTLIEIIKLPATAAAGGASSGVVKRAMRRVGGEVLATVCTLGVLVLLTLLAGFVMGRVVTPAIDSLITFFARAVDYLQFVQAASTAKVWLMLISVILFLALNLAVSILSMSFFLGKSQKIFQQRFNEGVPLAAHARWWRWAIPAVVVAQLLPLLYVMLSRFAVAAIERKVMAASTNADKVNWTALMLASPLFLVIGFLGFFWAARGFKAIGFLAGYKVKRATPLMPTPTGPSTAV